MIPRSPASALKKPGIFLSILAPFPYIIPSFHEPIADVTRFCGMTSCNFAVCRLEANPSCLCLGSRRDGPLLRHVIIYLLFLFFLRGGDMLPLAICRT